MIKLLLTNSKGTFDITKLAGYYTWSGEYTQANRKLEFTILSSPTDKNIPVTAVELGNLVELYNDTTLLFYGYVFYRDKVTDQNYIEVRCSDKGIYLNRNEASYKFTKTTPEQVAKKICNDFGIKAGKLTSTGFTFSRTFLGNNLYDIIMTGYNLASAKNGKKYIAKFIGDSFYVTEKAIADDTLIIQGGSNLMKATFCESIENMVNKVVIYDKKDKYVTSVKNDSYIKLYGVMQQYMKQSDSENVNDKAKKVLADQGIDKKVSIDNIGNIANITGGAVVVKEPYTGLYGLFYIDSDTHSWKNGIYLNNLVLNFKNIMDDTEVGNVIKNKTNNGDTFQYLYKP